MNKYEFTINERTFARVSKAVAKQAFVNGFTIALCPSNLRPGMPWHPEAIINIEMYGDDIANDKGAENDFNKLLNSFEYCNCVNTETGKYTAFFIETDDNYMHFSFSDGSNPFVFYGSTLECMKELKRWAKHFSIEFQKQHYYKLTERR